jgi:hypothetical protein
MVSKIVTVVATVLELPLKSTAVTFTVLLPKLEQLKVDLDKEVELTSQLSVIPLFTSVTDIFT